ncbi:peptidase C58 [Pseudomonas syringae]|uniref:type III secretion system effector cysteine protease HopN1 n=1 Tax=Pseudomonas syringae TaxID=317 RepID=UPI000C07718F|nr:type III secretion system effector cysteine protease HopN1 [Pseudomonas syringae]PHN54189.1 peptidase C58 [Pseudomonas syringae]
MYIQQSGAQSGVAAKTQHDKASSLSGLAPGSSDAFARFHPEPAGAFVPLEGHEEVFFDARSSFSSVDAADLPSPEQVQPQLHSLRTLLPDLMVSIASLRDGTTQYIKSRIKAMADSSVGATANIEAKRKIAQEHGCQLVHPFHQSKFLFEKTIDDRAFAADYGRAGGDGHACLGLSVNWCQSRAKGQPDEAFFHKLEDYQGDALLPRVMGFQHIEQQAYSNKMQNAAPMLLDTLPKLGMTLGKGLGRAQHAHYAVALENLDRDLKAVLQPGKDQMLLFLSDSHAMALHQDSQGCLHFFDPLIGVVQADSFSNMSHFLADVFKRDVGTHWRGTEQRLQLSEMVPRADFHLR